MKILFVVSTLGTGGTQRVFANLSTHLPEGITCDFLLNDTEDIVYDYRGNLISLDLPATEDKSNLKYQALVAFNRYKKLKRLKASGEYDICISGLTSANFLNVITRTKKCKTLVSVHNDMTNTFEKSHGIAFKVEKIMMKPSIRNCDTLVGVSKGVVADLVKNYGAKAENSFAIYNPVPCEEIVEKANQQLLPEDTKLLENCDYILSVGRLCNQKGYEYLIDAMALVHEKQPELKLVILGEGELREEYEKQIAKKGLKNTVYLMGFKANPYPIWKNAKAFVVSSIFEGLSNVIIESLALGIPVISTDFNCGAREILAPDTSFDKRVTEEIEVAKYGVLTPVALDEKGVRFMAEAIENTISDKPLMDKLKTSGPDRAKDFSTDEIIKQWIKIL